MGTGRYLAEEGNIMFIKEDRSFREIREKSVIQWLDAMSRNDNLEVRGGVRATMDYISGLKQEIAQLEQSNAVKDKYLKKIKMKDTHTITEE